MSLSTIDTTRDLRTPDELRELVEAIYNSPANAQETNWLEWKSSLDLGTAEGRFAVGWRSLGSPTDQSSRHISSARVLPTWSSASSRAPFLG
jgi:hypothetical protein